MSSSRATVFLYSLGFIGLTLASTSPARAQSVNRFDSGIVLSGAWLQANALPLDRDAVQSGAIDASWRWHRWSIEAGWLRIARDLSTIQGIGLPGSAPPLEISAVHSSAWDFRRTGAVVP